MKRISDQRRVLDLAFSAKSREEILSIIETLKGVAENRFPSERKTRKRKPKIVEAKAPEPKPKAKAKAAGADDEPEFLTRHPTPQD